MGLVLVSTNAFASKLANVKTLTNPVVESVSNELNSMPDVVTHSSKKKVLVLKASGSTAQKVRENTVAQALHTLCPYFDDGVEATMDIKNIRGSKGSAQTFTDGTTVSEGSASFDAVLNAIHKVNTLADVEVYSGAASGNNTVGNVLAFFDVKNNEIAVFANTNCGSDN